MRFSSILIVILVITGVYLLPSVLAKFAGTHTVEVNQTGGVQQLRCIECHEYAFDELNSTVAQSVLKKHKNAAGNSTYTLSWLQRSLNNQTDEGICILCHGVIKAYENLSHTGVVMRVCTDINCHGNNETTNNTMYSAGNVGPVLGNTNAHEEWFDDMGSYLTRHQNESGANLTRDYYTCLGCHTYTEVDISISRANYDHSDPSYSKNRYI